MPPFVHLALAQLKPRKGDYKENLRRLQAVFAQVDQLEPRPGVLCLAESALTGYFLTRHVLEPRGLMLADERAYFIAALARALPSVA